MEKTLLDQFAMAALTGIVSDSKRFPMRDNYAREAYKYAQAMMEERKKHIEAETKKDNEWICWPHSHRPVTGETIVAVQCRDGMLITDYANSFSWGDKGQESDIIKYRVLK